MNLNGAFPIVAVGASAGGIEALEGFLRGLPNDADLAVVVVTHLSSTHSTHLPQILARLTSIPVVRAETGMQVQAGHIYVMPEDSVMGIDGGVLSVMPLDGRREPKPVDIFFGALAADQQESAIGVVLSGGDSDGTLGLKAIRERGGMTMAQVADGFGPQNPEMPDSAIRLGLVDYALPVEDMGAALVTFASSVNHLEKVLDLETHEQLSRRTVEAVSEVYMLLNSQVGHDFSGYKPKTFLRRVQRRMNVLGVNDIEDYVTALRADAEEVGHLFRDLLISVTNFFRDPEAFQCLEEKVIPQLLARDSTRDSIRIWVPGCATGEEVYSIAILLLEQMAGMEAPPRIQLFATDIDERALAVARSARYPRSLLDSVSEERRERFFIADGESMVVAKRVREMCIFSPHSVIRDPPFSRIDLVSCRNLMIYFGPDVQAQVVPTFHYALRQDGFLFLGTAENLSQFDELFAPVDAKHRVFKRRTGMTPLVRLPMSLMLSRHQAGEPAARRVPTTGSVRHGAESQVLDRYSPPHVVIASTGDVIYFSARTGKYLEVPAGAPTRQIFTLARRELRLDLRTLFREAVESGRTAQRGGLPVEVDDGRVQMVNMIIEPMQDRQASEALYLVLFVDQGPPLTRDEVSGLGSSGERANQLVHSERELRETRDRLQSLIEEYETALEELKSSNEELVSVNEEMQSTNEELEASKEELQSVNEELHTVNAELHVKLEALDCANNDLLNLFRATDVATIFLDERFLIRSFTPAVGSIFNIRNGDIGRPITDLSVRVVMDDLQVDLQRAVEKGVLVERRATAVDGTSDYLMRIGPYVDAAERNAGVVMSFMDVTSLVKSEERQQILIAELQHRTRNLLGIVQAIAMRTLGKGDDVADFGLRLAALGRAQSLLGGTLAGEVDLGEMISSELSSLGVPMERVELTGCKVALGFDVAQTFSLALHELTTNAIKYGAFKVDNGRLCVRWGIEQRGEEQVLALTWKESGVVISSSPSRKGFGSQLIVHAMSHSLNAKTRLDYASDGVFCSIEVPHH